jgi:rubrerythrin
LETAGIIRIVLTASLLFFVCCGREAAPDVAGLENALNGMILEKALRAGYYRAAAQQAEKQGYAEVATYLGEIAEEERGHLSRLATIRAHVKKETEKNIVSLIGMEKTAAKSAYPMLGALAKQQGNDSLAILISQMQADEQRHLSGLKGILERVK